VNYLEEGRLINQCDGLFAFVGTCLPAGFVFLAPLNSNHHKLAFTSFPVAVGRLTNSIN